LRSKGKKFIVEVASVLQVDAIALGAETQKPQKNFPCGF
jgi:hypothetical protein